MTEKNYYDILAIKEGATPEEIKKAYRSLVLKWHPDKFKQGKSLAKTEKEAKEMMQKLSEAYEKLSNNEEKRKSEYEVNYYFYSGLPKELGTQATFEGFHEKTFNFDQETLKYLVDLENSYQILAKFERDRLSFQDNAVNDYDLVRVKELVELFNTISEHNTKGREFENKYGHHWKSTRIAYVQALKNTAWKRKNGDAIFFWFNGHSSWESNVNQVKKVLNYARRGMGLSELTDQDFAVVKTNNQNNQPDSPKIKDSIANIEEYNNLYYQGNHKTIRKYNELWYQVYDLRGDFPLWHEIDNKQIEISGMLFLKMWKTNDDNDNETIRKNSESKLKKMEEVIKLMEKFIAERKKKNDKLVVENTQSGDKDKKNKSDEFVSRQEVAKKSQAVGHELSQLIHEAQALNSYEQLAVKIKEIDKHREEEVYKQFQEQIKQLKITLGSLDKGKYRESIVKGIKNKLDESGIKESDLDEATKNKLAKIKSGEIQDTSEIDEVENKIVAKTGEKNAENALNSWLQQAKKLLESTKSSTADYLYQELKKIKKGLYDFQYSTNIYQKKIYQTRAKDVQAMLSKLENYSVPTKQTSSDGLFRPEIIVPVSLLTVVAVAALVIVRRKKRMKVK